ncbi:hypothetical protein AB832_06900 [Flavobacteriaceae bacterium (ex Bugula neritina AB1)]|nr:hypothetical protein AB832_06900 [Flavobacteriaceae bacterium (ex Bugula neritina AB1)]
MDKQHKIKTMSINKKVGNIYEDQNGTLVQHPKAGEIKSLIVDFMQDGWTEWKGLKIVLRGATAADDTTHRIVDPIPTRTPDCGVNIVDFVVEDL